MRYLLSGYSEFGKRIMDHSTDYKERVTDILQCFLEDARDEGTYRKYNDEAKLIHPENVIITVGHVKKKFQRSGSIKPEKVNTLYYTPSGYKRNKSKDVANKLMIFINKELKDESDRIFIHVSKYYSNVNVVSHLTMHIDYTE